MSQLSNALFTETQQKVLGLLYGQPERSFYTKEILRRTGMGVATIKRELDRMLAAGILSMTRIGNQHHYQANPQCPIYGELLAIVKKTFGVTEVIRLALSRWRKRSIGPLSSALWPVAKKPRPVISTCWSSVR